MTPSSLSRSIHDPLPKSISDKKLAPIMRPAHVTPEIRAAAFQASMMQYAEILVNIVRQASPDTSELSVRLLQRLMEGKRLKARWPWLVADFTKRGYKIPDWIIRDNLLKNPSYKSSAEGWKA